MARQREHHKIDQSLIHLSCPVNDLTLDPENAREHNEENLRVIRASLERFGQDQPLVVQKNGLIVRKGNGRLLAARQLGWTHVACVIVDEDDINAMARAIVDNRSAELARWDSETLALCLQKIQEQSGEPVESIGFTQEQVDALRVRMAPEVSSTPTETEDRPSPLVNEHVRVFQLFFDENTIEEFRELLVGLMRHLGTQSDTQTILNVMREAYESIIAEVPDEQA